MRSKSSRYVTFVLFERFCYIWSYKGVDESVLPAFRERVIVCVRTREYSLRSVADISTLSLGLIAGQYRTA